MMETARAMGLLTPNFQNVDKSAPANWAFIVTPPSKSAYPGNIEFPEGTKIASQSGAPSSNSFSQPQTNMPAAMQSPPSSFNSQPQMQPGGMMGSYSSGQPQVQPNAGSFSSGQPQAQPSGGQGRPAKALYPFSGQDNTEISFNPGDIIMVSNQTGEWWVGEINGRRGYFPSNYVQLL